MGEFISVDLDNGSVFQRMDSMREQNLFCDFDFNVSSSLSDPPKKTKKMPVHKVVISSTLRYFE